MSVNDNHLPLISNNNTITVDGPLNSTSHMVSLKLAYLLKAKQWTINEFNLKLLTGIGLNYVLNFDGDNYFFEGRTRDTEQYYLGINLDSKQVVGVQTTQSFVNRLPSIQGILTAQLSKKDKPFGLELYWGPGITPAIRYVYTTGLNYAIAASGNAGQMQNDMGVKFIYNISINER